MKKINYLLLLGLVLPLTSCFGEKPEGPSDSTHVHTYDENHIVWTWDDSTKTASAVATCSECGKSLAAVTDSSPESKVTKRATCTAEGTEKYTATVTIDGASYENYKEYSIPKVDHTYTQPVSAVNASCVQEGRKEYCTCEVCDTIFVIENGVKTPVDSEADLIVNKVDHVYTPVSEVPSTCKDNGTIAHYHCSVCNKDFLKEGNEYRLATANDLKLELVDHTYGSEIDEVPSTCQQAGTIAHYHCSVCDKNFLKVNENYVEASADDLKIPEAHTYGAVTPEVAANCTTDGTKAYCTCSTCSAKFIVEGTTYTKVNSDDELKIAAHHKYGELISEVAPGCTTTGTAAHYKCSVCGKLFDSNKVEKSAVELQIAAKGHDYTVFTPVDGVEKHDQTCSHGDDTKTNVDCSYSFDGEGHYCCVCGRDPFQNLKKINLDITVTDVESTDVFSIGDNMSFGLNASLEELIKDVKIDNESIWDTEKNKFDLDKAYKLYGEKTVTLELGDDTNTATTTVENVKFVSKSISTEAELKTMHKIARYITDGNEKMVDGYFELANDIELTKIDNTTEFNWSNKEGMAVNSTSADSDSTDGFVGVFDGMGHSIRYLCPESGGAGFNPYGKDAPNGFIANLKAPGTIKNVAFTDVRFNFTKTSIIGQGNGTVENVYIQILNYEGKSYISPLFSYNGYSAAIPTVKNVVVDYCTYNNATVSIPAGSVQRSFGIGGNKNADFPDMENFFVITNTSKANTNVPNWFGFCFGMLVEANYSKYGRTVAAAKSYDFITYDEFVTKYKDKEYLFSLGSSSKYDSELCATFKEKSVDLFKAWEGVFGADSQVETLRTNIGLNK